MTVRRFPLFYAFILVVLLLASAQLSSAQEIVLYASQAPVKAGNWSSVADSTAAGGARLHNSDAGAAKILTAAANPASYAELTFSASAGIPYRIWVRGKAQSNSPYNDSIFVQFSGSLNSSGNAAYRIGSTSATEINLEDCTGCGIQGWGWQDNGWGVGILGPAIFFQSTGTQTLRIQTREDGFSIDQIVLSPSLYLYNSPGALKNDSVILLASSDPAPTPTPTPTSSAESPNNTRLPPATQIVDSTGSIWTRSSNGAILRNGASTAGTGSEILYCNRIVYVLGTDLQWWKWSSGWVPTGSVDPCSGSTAPTTSTESANNTRLPPATQIVDSTGGVWTRTSSGTILRNGAGTGGAGSEILYCNRIVYVFGNDSQWWRWNGGWTPVGFVDPCSGAITTPTLTESAHNTRLPPATQIVDSKLDVWTISNSAILRNGGGTAGTGSQILYCNQIVYVLGSDSNWWRWNNGWVFHGALDPCGATPANQPPTLSITATPTSGNSPLSVSFASSASDVDGYITSYSWNLGNGVTSSVPNPTNIYQSPGTYTAALTVVDNSGATATKSVQISVSSAPSTSATLKVLSWNVSFGKGTDNVLNWDRMAAWIANMNPDLAALCEMPPGDVSTLVTLLNLKTGRSWYAHFVDKYPGNWEGNLILSKHSFISTNGRYLSYNRSVAQATVSIGGKNVNFFATHLDADSSSIRYQQVGELMSWASGFTEQRIVAGDFNGGPDTSESVRMTSTYYDSWMRAMNAGTAVGYPDNPVGMHTRTRRGRIDYVFYSQGAGNLYLNGTQIPDTRDLSNTNVVVTLGTLDDKGVRPSDHNPMIATFEIR